LSDELDMKKYIDVLKESILEKEPGKEVLLQKQTSILCIFFEKSCSEYYFKNFSSEIRSEHMMTYQFAKKVISNKSKFPYKKYGEALDKCAKEDTFGVDIIEPENFERSYVDFIKENIIDAKKVVEVFKSRIEDNSVYIASEEQKAVLLSLLEEGNCELFLSSIFLYIIRSNYEKIKKEKAQKQVEKVKKPISASQKSTEKDEKPSQAKDLVDEIIDESLDKKKSQKPKLNKNIIAFIVIVFVVAAFIIMNLINQNSNISFSDIKNIDFEQTLTFNKDENFVSYSETSKEDAFNLAVGSISTLKNEGDKELRLTKSELIVHDIKEAPHQELTLILGIENNVLSIYAVNNGMKTINDKRFSIAMKQKFNGDAFKQIDMERFLGSQTFSKDLAKIEGGEISKIFEYQLTNDFINLLQEKTENMNPIIAIIVSDPGKKSEATELFSNTFRIIDNDIKFTQFGGMGEQNLIQNFILVDSAKENCSYQMNITNRVAILPKATGVMDTLLIPDKSCQITFSYDYEFGRNSKIESENSQATIRVPVYKIRDSPTPNDEMYNYLKRNNIDSYKFNEDSDLQLTLGYTQQDLKKVISNTLSDEEIVSYIHRAFPDELEKMQLLKITEDKKEENRITEYTAYFQDQNKEDGKHFKIKRFILETNVEKYNSLSDKDMPDEVVFSLLY
jgi:hypothetical protein